MSSRATSSTGPAASAARRRPSCGPAASTRSRASCGSARHARVASCRRAATPASSADRCRSRGEIVLSLRRLDALGPVDAAAGQVTAGAGVTLGRAPGARARGRLGVRRRPRRHATRATVGGTIATNAGGVHVLRYGPTRRQVVGVEAVLADGVGRRSPRRAGEGQHRLRPRRAVVRQRGHARPSSPRPGCGSFPPASTSSSRCSPSTTSTTRSPRSVCCAASVDALRALEFFEQERARSRVRAARACRRRSPRRTARTCSSRRPAASIRPTRSPRRRRARRRRRRRGRDRRRAAARAVALPRGAHRGDQPPRSAAQARRDAARRSALAEFFARVPTGCRGGRARRAGLAVRSRGRRQRARERHRRRTRRRPRHRRGAAPRRRAARFDQRRARHRDGQAAVGAPHAQRRPSCARSARSRTRSTPHGILNPNVLLP